MFALRDLVKGERVDHTLSALRVEAFTSLLRLISSQMPIMVVSFTRCFFLLEREELTSYLPR